MEKLRLESRRPVRYGICSVTPKDKDGPGWYIPGALLHWFIFHEDDKDVMYSFIGRGRRQRVYSQDLVSFDYYVNKRGFNTIIEDSIVCIDKNGVLVARATDYRPKGWAVNKITIPPESKEFWFYTSNQRVLALK